MPITWNFEGGFSKLLTTASLKLTLRKPPAGFSLDAYPVDLLRGGRNPLRLQWDAGRRWSVRLDPAGHWSVRPEGYVELTLLPPRAAYLGNFRVPEGRVGIQWRVSGTAEGEGVFSRSPLCSLKARRRVSFIWIETHPGLVSLAQVLESTWSGFVDPLDPTQVSRLTEDRVLQFSWSGGVTLGFSLPWSEQVSRTVGFGLAALDTILHANARAQLRTGVTVSRAGSFSLRWWRRQGQLRATLNREKSAEVKSDLTVGVETGGGLDLKPGTPWLRPVVRELEKAVTSSLSRRIGLALALSGRRTRRQRTVLRLTAKASVPSEAVELACHRLLSGQLPAHAPGIQVESIFEELRSRETVVRLQLLDWTAERSVSREEKVLVSVAPDGQVVVERGVEAREVRTRWEEIQFFRVLWANRNLEAEEPVTWSTGLEGRTSRERVLRFLRGAVHAGVQDGFSLPAGGPRWDGRILWLTRFSPAGIRSLFENGASRGLDAICRALELTEPGLYGRSGFHRDWMESPELRQVIDRDPLGAPLPNRYPVPGRTETQRRLVVDDYRRVRAFLRLLDRATPLDGADTVEVLRRGFRLPIFLCCHFLVPPDQRQSAVLLEANGARTLWGHPELLSDEGHPKP